MHVLKGETKMIIIKSVHWLSPRGLSTFHSIDTEGETIGIIKDQCLEGSWNVAIMLSCFYISYFSLRSSDQIFQTLAPADIGILILWSIIIDIKFST